MAKTVLVPLTLPANPTNALEAAPKQYVDARAGIVGPLGQVEVAFITDATANMTLTSLPSAEDYIGASVRYVAKVDLSLYTQCRLVVRKMATAGSAGSVITLKYSTTDPANAFSGAAWTSSGAQVSLAASNTTLDTGWIAMPTGMKVDNINIVPTQSGGDGATSPVIGTVRAYFKGAAGTSAAVLDDLADTIIATPTDGQVLTYETASSQWKNKAATGGGGLTDGDKGDITVASSGASLTIDSGAVTGAKIATDTVTNTNLAPMPTLTVKGNATGATAGPTDLTAAQAKTLLAIASTDVSGLGSLATKSTILSTDITDGQIVNADMAAMAALTVKGNASGSSGAVADLTMAQVRTMLNSSGGPFFGFDFDTATSSGSSTVTLRLSSATVASVTSLYINYTAKEGVALKTRLLSGTAGDRIYIQERTNAANYAIYELTAAPTDFGTYAVVPVVYRTAGGSLWANATALVAGFASPSFTIATSAPASPLVNDLWVDTT